jgi:hypothetical protein
MAQVVSVGEICQDREELVLCYLPKKYLLFSFWFMHVLAFVVSCGLMVIKFDDSPFFCLLCVTKHWV